MNDHSHARKHTYMPQEDEGGSLPLSWQPYGSSVVSCRASTANRRFRLTGCFRDRYRFRVHDLRFYPCHGYERAMKLVLIFFPRHEWNTLSTGCRSLAKYDPTFVDRIIRECVGYGRVSQGDINGFPRATVIRGLKTNGSRRTRCTSITFFKEAIYKVALVARLK